MNPELVTIATVSGSIHAADDCVRIFDTTLRDSEQAFDVLDLTDDELAKLHMCHMIGGRSSLAQHERLYRFEFPERPGALTHFLGQLHPDWNINLFHYRNHGADCCRILVGIQLPDASSRCSNASSPRSATRTWTESNHPAYRLLLRQ